MTCAGAELGVPLHVFGPETHMTAIVGMALGKRSIQKPQNLELPSSTFGLPKVSPRPRIRASTQNQATTDYKINLNFILYIAHSADVPLVLSNIAEWKRTRLEGQHTMSVSPRGGHAMGAGPGGRAEGSQTTLHTRNTSHHLWDAAEGVSGDAGL